MHILLNLFLKNQNYNINADELKLQLLSHPSYPSLHSITDVLGHFNIDNLAIEVPKDFETLKQLPNSFLSIISNDKGQEYVIITQLKNGVELLYDTKKKERKTIDEFLNNWGGVVVAIEKEEKVITKK